MIHLIWLQEYAAIERGAVSLTFKTGMLDNSVQQWLITANKMQTELLNDIDLLDREEEHASISQQLMAPSFNAFYETRRIFQQKAKRNELLSKIYRIIGYGGLIHHFNNYLIRGEIENRTMFMQLLEQCKVIIGKYRSTPGLSKEEIDALS